MKLQQLLINKNHNKEIVFASDNFQAEKADLVLVFAQRTVLDEVLPYASLKSFFPAAQIIICSSSGQISNNNRIEEDIVATAISFDKTKIKTTQIDILLDDNIDELGKKIKTDLLSADLKSMLICRLIIKLTNTVVIMMTTYLTYHHR